MPSRRPHPRPTVPVTQAQFARPRSNAAQQNKATLDDEQQLTPSHQLRTVHPV
eukprot:CAMPEP_0174382730 /NCGR_PEP_ID=MMETSP0811_2-20130205/124773_1 /TAXON_ID=73025 ORGANISM="Eutreptiella gymnastica-like, Strain CCMP1594" /NCGR_SAMPLE_ID=MMETSP0811_2 /ASSEMBLY_ACC=CAM_ASM_000667 /LENGTH=52 /DNA_ID=CAMNT_0015536099 /DNA_START=875 /DNA_END=1033 /DNA_ORIENTATION=+